MPSSRAPSSGSVWLPERPHPSPPLIPLLPATSKNSVSICFSLAQLWQRLVFLPTQSGAAGECDQTGSNTGKMGNRRLGGGRSCGKTGRRRRCWNERVREEVTEKEPTPRREIKTATCFITRWKKAVRDYLEMNKYYWRNFGPLFSKS